MEEIETTPPQAADRAWGQWLAALVLIVLAYVGLQVVTVYSEARDAGGSDGFQSLMTGDLSVKYSLAGIDSEQKAEDAVSAYEDALPQPAAYRRIGITKIALLHKRQASELQLLASPKATKSLTKGEIAELRREAAMWAEAFSGRAIGVERAEEMARTIRKLNLGPLRDVAVAEVYRRSGQAARADAALAEAKRRAFVDMALMVAIILVAIAGGIVGIVLAVTFFSRPSGDTGTPIPVSALPSILLRAFLVFLVGSTALSVALGGLVALMGGDHQDALLAAAVLVQIAAMLAAVAISMSYLGGRVGDAGAVLREIGLRAMGFAGAIRWGVGGYLGALPFLVIALIVTQFFLNTVFKGLPAPVHPIAPAVESGGALTWIAAIVLAVIVAPLVEEIAFRGLLYTALRARMGMWPSVIISGSIFSALHPTIPAQFLLLAVLGCAFAVIREKTGSLVPAMICHAINNGAMFLLLWLVT